MGRPRHLRRAALLLSLALFGQPISSQLHALTDNTAVAAWRLQTARAGATPAYGTLRTATDDD